MSTYSPKESNWNSTKKHTLSSNGEYSSPTKRSRPSLSQRLGLADESDPSDDEPYSPTDNNSFDTQQRIIRQPQASLRESTLIASGQPSKAILELLKDDDEDEEEEEIEDEAYSPSQLDPATMDEVSHQLKGLNQPLRSIPIPVSQPATYIPPISSASSLPLNTHQQDMDYREKKKLSDNTIKHELNQNSCRIIPIHGECTGVDPRLRIHSARLRLKVRQLVLERLSTNDLIDRNEILEELDHLVESHGRRLYWYRVICFLQNISLTNNTPKQIHYYLKEVSKLLVLTPNISKILKIKQKYPKTIPIDTNEIQTINDPRSKTFTMNNIHLKPLRYK
ncbi:unnamed protein product [Rotaria socialis]|uniref:Uncharacterized protein n=1 Tax=Rotaria socialis TaxID=392032 RepID=A0A818HZG5_9BILA|nr:unnamed protein product [Rotaria socialis]CAF3363843.1 unnamed protein product [Rotaria socialis]CAF3512023.1 unnamed protein product [Rotaria socialis]CAF3652214.1 unnamed protein product [Rotaria socialis]CAF3730279.1 unnamed protein product [Rotaria socialis]